jgi:hypothetical protein
MTRQNTARTLETVGDLRCSYGRHLWTVATDDQNPEEGQPCACGTLHWRANVAAMYELALERPVNMKAAPEQ